MQCPNIWLQNTKILEGLRFTIFIGKKIERVGRNIHSQPSTARLVHHVDLRASFEAVFWPSPILNFQRNLVIAGV